jgi:hypothetical protein
MSVKSASKICIYCRGMPPERVFNREHVLHVGFGRFKHALVLHNCVCQPCNTYFSTTLDRALTRQSIEGLERYVWGIKAPEEIEHFDFNAVSLRAHDVGEFTGVPVRLVPGSGPHGLIARIVPSAAIRNATNDEFSFFSVSDVESGAWKSANVDWKRGIRLLGPDEALLRMRTALEAQGVMLNYRPIELPESQGDGLQIVQEFRISEDIKRGIAKVAFNYLAFRFGASLALHPAFDAIRNYIRQGAIPALPPVESTLDLPFRLPDTATHQPVVHWISLETHPAHMNFLGIVSLFSLVKHVVVLAQDFRGPWPELPVAHLYNLKLLSADEMKPQRPLWRPPDRSTE